MKYFDPLLENIPEGKRWGQWDVEDIDCKHGGLREFVGLQPKSYGVKAADGTNYIKVKGVSLKAANEPILNFEKMVELAKSFLDDPAYYLSDTFSVSDNDLFVNVPQMNFDYKLGGQIQTRYAFKKFMFNPKDLKGSVRDGLVYPYGYIHQ